MGDRARARGRVRSSVAALCGALVAMLAATGRAAPPVALEPQPSSVPGGRWVFPEAHVREVVGPREAVIDHDPPQGRRRLALHELVGGRVLRELDDLWDPQGMPPDVLATPEALLLVLGGGKELAAIDPRPAPCCRGRAWPWGQV